MRKQAKYPVLLVVLVFQILFYYCGDNGTDNIKNRFNRKVKVASEPVKAKHFFFVGKWLGKESIYKYSFDDSSYSVFWFQDKEKVLEFLYSDDLKYAFFITARKLGTRHGVSFIKKLKLYRVDPLLSKTGLISELGEAIQLLAQWNGMNFEIQLTKFDKKIASEIDKFNRLYSPFGKLLKEEVEKFDFIKEGYPPFTIRQPKLISPSGVFGLTAKGDSIFLRVAGMDKDVFIDSSGHSFNEVRWINEDEAVIFSTRKIINSGKERTIKSELFVYDLVHRKIDFKRVGEGRMNFLIANDLLIFDDGIGNKSSIVMIDLKSNNEIKKLFINGGCSLKSIIY